MGLPVVIVATSESVIRITGRNDYAKTFMVAIPMNLLYLIKMIH